MPKTPALVPTVAVRRGLRWYELDLNSFGITTLQSFDAMGPPRKIFLAPALCRVATLEKVQRKYDDRCYKQQVNQAVSNKASIKPNQPQQQQHYKNCPQHESYLLTWKCLKSVCLRLDYANETVCALDHIHAILSAK